MIIKEILLQFTPNTNAQQQFFNGVSAKAEMEICKADLGIFLQLCHDFAFARRFNLNAH